MAAPSSLVARGPSNIVDAVSGAIATAPAPTHDARTPLHLEGIKNPEILLRMLTELQRELDGLRAKVNSVLLGSVFIRNVTLPAATTVLIHHRLGRAPLGVFATCAVQTGAGSGYAIQRTSLPAGRDEREWIAVTCSCNTDSVDLLVF